MQSGAQASFERAGRLNRAPSRARGLHCKASDSISSRLSQRNKNLCALHHPLFEKRDIQEEKYSRGMVLVTDEVFQTDNAFVLILRPRKHLSTRLP
jgi:hypothetical protein